MGGIVDAIFGGGNDAAPVEAYKPYAFNSSGLSMNLWGGGGGPYGVGGSFINGGGGGQGFDLLQSPEMKNWLQNTSGAFGEQAQGLEQLLPMVSPAFGNLSKAAMGNIENQRLRTIGDLRENLARRRVGGSSFASDAAARTDAEFAQKKAEVGAQMTLAEIDTTTKLLEQVTGAKVNQWQTFIQQSNFEAGLAAQLSSGVSSAMASNAQMAAQINAQNTANSMDVVGTAAGFAAMPYLMALSDRRLKTNIRPVAELSNGLTWYEFDYIWGEPSEGVMADEVERLYPDAVFELDGYMAVDYSKIWSTSWH